MITSQQIQFQYQYEIAPILLVNGLAANLPNGLMSILTLTEGADIFYPDANDYFAHFKVVGGNSLQEWQVAEYPFASIQMAANAVIQMPLKVSLMMACPAQNNGNGYFEKQAVLTNLKTQLDNHILAGGTFIVATPAYTYSNCILTNLRDVSTLSDKQVQFMYQWDFVQPLVTQQAATATYNNLMTKIGNGTPTPTNLDNWGGTGANIGASQNYQPQSNASLFSNGTGTPTNISLP